MEKRGGSQGAMFVRGFLITIVILPAVIFAVPTPVPDCTLCNATDCRPFDTSVCEKQQCLQCCNGCERTGDESCGNVNGSHGICADGYECVVRASFALSPQEYSETPGVCVATGKFVRSPPES